MKLKQKIYADALKAMGIPILLHTAETCAEGILTVFTATILGQFADSVFRLDFTLGTKSMVHLSLALLAMIAVLPAFSLLANVFMLKYALVHDRMILGRFLDKTYDSILRYELGDIQNRLDWDPTELRCYLVDYVDKGLMIPVTFAFLLFHALRLSPVYTLIVFALSQLKLAVPLAVKKLEGRYEKENREYASQLRSLETEFTNRSCMVALYRLGDAFSHKAAELYQAYFDRTEKKSIRLSAGAEAISSFTGTFCTLGILLSGSLLAAGGKITPGAVAAMYGYSAVFNTLLENMGFLIRNTPILKNTVERLIMFYENAETDAGEEIDGITDICCDAFSYSYEKPQESALDLSCENSNMSNAVSGNTESNPSHSELPNTAANTEPASSCMDSKLLDTAAANTVPASSCTDSKLPDTAATNTVPASSCMDSKLLNTTAANTVPATFHREENLPDETRREAAQKKAAITAPAFTIPQGGKTALCGANGTGKSTLMKGMLGLLTGYSGSIRINDKELSELNPFVYRRHIAYAPQDPYLFEGTVLENIRIGNPGLSDTALESLVDQMGITSLADRQVKSGNSGLSGGEKQKISIARAVAKGTEVLFLDEPGNNLDKATLDWLCGFLRESRQTVVFISHDSQLTACADNIVELTG